MDQKTSAVIRQRPRSTITPGRRLTDLHALIEAGEADDNSYLEMSTDSEKSVANRSASGRDFASVDDEEQNDILSNEIENIAVHEEDNDTRKISDENDPPAKKIRTGGMILEKQPFYRASRDDSRFGRPRRNRCPPCRWWLGEEPVYKWQSSGGGELQGVTDVVILDKLYMKYKTASPVTMIELLSAERRKRWGRPPKKRART